MSSKPSRRNILKAGLALPAAGLFSSNSLGSEEQQSGNKEAKAVYRTLGKTELKPSGVGYGIGYTPIRDVVARALDLGVNYFDTSRVYKDSEKIFGGIIKGRNRDKIIIATKSGQFKGEGVLKDIDTSLGELQTDYVDIMHLHARDSPAAMPDDVLEAVQKIRESGKARYLGFSTHDPNNMVDFVLEKKVFDVVQMTYSFPIGGFYRNQAVDKFRKAGVGVIAMKVAVGLTGLNLENFENKTAAEGEGVLSGIKWVLNNPGIGTTVPHMKTIEELEMNIRAMSEPYTPADEKLLYVMNEQIRPDYCRMCYECKGQCPQGMPVTDVLRFLAYHDFGGNYHQAAMSYRELSKEVRSIRCSDCSHCSIKCPNGVHVQDRLIRAQEFLA